MAAKMAAKKATITPIWQDMCFWGRYNYVFVYVLGVKELQYTLLLNNEAIIDT
jgi:hypothetical protein